jgi:hypothetical protein
MIKKILQNTFAILLGIGFTLLLLEIVFRTAMPAASLPKSLWNSEYNIPSFEPGTSGKYSFGKFCHTGGKWQINNEGWNSPYDYTKNNKPTIAIFGDSYIEAFQIDVEKSLGPVLQNKLAPQFNVFSFGTSGAPLSQYLQLARYANRKFEPQIMVLNLIHNDFDESIAAQQYNKLYLRYRKINDSTFAEDGIEKNPEASFRFKMLNATATGRYLLHNLKIQEMDFNSFFKRKSTSDTAAFNANIDVKKVLAQQDDIRKVTELILLQLKKEFPSTRLILLMDGLRKEIYDNTPPEESNIIWMNTMVKELANQHNIEFIDLTEAFAADYQKNNTHFESPYDWHWNEYGHRIAAETLYQQITSKTN